MLDGILDDILGNSPKRGEIRPDSPAVRPAQSRVITELSPNSPNSPGLLGEDRHFCRECLHLNRSGYCTRQRFRPVDDVPRRCEDFNGYDDVLNVGYAIGEADRPPAQANDPLLVEVWTPSGTALTIRADNAEHAAWLRKMNPKPENPAPKPPEPKPNTDRISEAEHNTQGRFFKFLATWPDGRQCYLCQMPRQTVDEMREQFPDAATIQPIENEDYTDDE
jgi:hypothetical protein